MKTRYIIAPIVMIAVLALAAFSTPAMADPCKPAVATSGCPGACGTNGTINGTLYVEDAGPTYSNTRTNIYRKDFTVPSGNGIKWARVHWHIWGGNPQAEGWTNATFCNATQCWNNNQYIPPVDGAGSPNNCDNDETDGFYMGGYGTHWVYWNVTDYASVGANNLTVNNSDWWDGRVMWMTMVAVLENNTKYIEMNYTINQGFEDLDAGGAADKSTTWFYGPANNSRNGTLWHHGLASHADFDILFNNHLEHHYPAIGGFMNLEELEINSNNISANDNNMTWDNSDGSDDFHPVMAIFMDNRVGTDLTVTDIDVGTPRPNNDSTVNATVKNWGKDDAGHFNVSLYIDNVLNGTVNVTAGLAAGASTTVSFTKVNESKGCYDFKVIVDVDGIIDEANEDNNETTVKGQVGYVILVESYHDFDDLVTESTNNLLGAGNVSHSGDTYYIKNFTGSSAIENCAGDGISIQNLNTSTKFEINNCTIKNCTHSGVYLRNLSNGTVNGSEMQNNSYYGINVYGLGDVSNTKLISITNNTINGSKIDGIDLIGLNCTVKNNNITNSTTYGIYLFGNYTDIMNNNITDNGNYGIKAYNSYNNNIYHNNFYDNNNSDNNEGLHQAWDNQNQDVNNWDDGTDGDNTGNYWDGWDIPDPLGPYSIDGDAGQVDNRPSDSQF